MAVPVISDRLAAAARWSWWTEAQAGIVGSLSVVAVVVTLGLLAFAPLGAAAASPGLQATFVTAAVGGLVYAWLGRAALPSAGPSSATALILASLVAHLLANVPPSAPPGQQLQRVLAGCAAAVALSGLVQVLLALAGLARLARLVPRPVLAGFMNGVALLIVVGQLPLLLGLQPGTPLRPDTLARVQPGALALGLGSVLTIVLLNRLRMRWPVALVTLLAGTLAWALLHRLWPGLGLGPRIDIGPLSPPQVLSLPPALVLAVVQDHAAAVLTCATVLALVGALESALNLLAMDQHQHTRHEPQRELLAMGLTNVVCGVLGGLPAVALRARAMAIARAGGHGARAVLAGSLGLGLLYTAGAPLLAQLPLAVLGALMVMVGVDLLDRMSARQLLGWWRGEGSAELRSGLGVMALVCGVTLWQGFAAGVALGVLLSMAIFIARMNRSLLRSRLDGAQRPSRRVYPALVEERLAPQRPGIEIWELEGALFFGNADRLMSMVQTLPATARVLVLDLRRITTVDETGASTLVAASQLLQQRGLPVLLCGLAAGSDPDRALLAHGLSLPRLPDADRAIEAAEQHLLGPEAETTMAARHLANSELLQGLDAQQVQQVCQAMAEQRLFAGDTLFRQGDAADGLYVLTLGSVSVIGREGGGTQRYLSISPGMMLGETALLDGGGRSADAVADTFAVLQHLTRDALERLTREHPAVAAQLNRNIAVHLSRRLRAATQAWAASQR